MGAVQFFGIPAVLQQYDNEGIPVWAIYQGRKLLTAGDSAETLQQYLEAVSVGYSSADYILVLYSDVDSAIQVRPSTEYSRCFTFKLTAPGSMGMAVAGPGRMGGAMDAVTAKLQGIVADEVGKVIDKKLGRGDEDDNEDETITDIIKGYLRDPEKLMGVIGMAKQIFAGGTVAMPAGIAGAQPVRVGAAKTAEPSQEYLLRLQLALDRLGRSDPALLENLEKLAKLAEQKPVVYNMAIAQLNAL